MGKKIITGEGIQKSHLPFLPALQASNFVFDSGQASVDDTGKIVQDTFEGECGDLL